LNAAAQFSENPGFVSGYRFSETILRNQLPL
jgi:hypothetical protein